MQIFDPALAPFTISLLLMMFIALVEMIGLVSGVSIPGMTDSEADMDGAPGAPLSVDAGSDAPPVPGAGPVQQLLSWLGVGRVPVLILLAALLLAFGLGGLLLQNALNTVAGFFLPSWIAGPVVFAGALPVTRVLGRAVARLLPKEETDAVPASSFVGRVATILRGEAKRGLPAEAKLKDVKGATHYVLVEPDEDGVVFSSGSEVLLVERTGAVFRAIKNPSAALSATGALEGRT
jgi:hypothetical protein